MSNEVIIAITSAGSALFGSLMGIIGTIVTQKLKYKHEMNEEVKKNKLELYSRFITTLQSFMNNGKTISFELLTEMVNKIKIMGSNKVSNIIAQYYFDICSGKKMTDKENGEYQTKIINEMRVDLGLKQSLKENLGLFANRIESNNNIGE